MATDRTTILLAMDFVMRTWPWYNTSGGKDHFTVWGWDDGACLMGNDPILKDTIKVSHFGNTRKTKMMICNQIHSGPGADVVIPDLMEQHFKRSTGLKYMTPDKSKRDVFVCYSGTRGTDSSGIRSEVFDYFQNHSSLIQHNKELGDVVIVDTSLHARPPEFRLEGLGDLMKRSKFCLDPPGAGFSTRATLAITLGCVPIYLGSFKKPFVTAADTNPLNSSKYSLTVGRESIHRLLDILKLAHDRHYPALKRNSDKVWPHYTWSSILGPVSDEPLSLDAFHTMLDALCRHRNHTLNRSLPSYSQLKSLPCSVPMIYEALEEV